MTQIYRNITHACSNVRQSMAATQSHVYNIVVTIRILTKSLIRTGKEESIHRQKEEEDQICDEIE